MDSLDYKTFVEAEGDPAPQLRGRNILSLCKLAAGFVTNPPFVRQSWNVMN